MEKLTRVAARGLVTFLFVLCVGAVALAQDDRDLTAGSSTGSAIPDGARNDAPRAGMAPENRSRFISKEFRRFEPVAAEMGTTRQAMLSDYNAQLERFLAANTGGRPGQGLLTPGQYVTARLVEYDLRQTRPEVKAQALLDNLLAKKSFKEALVSLGLSPSEASAALKRASQRIKELTK